MGADLRGRGEAVGGSMTSYRACTMGDRERNESARNPREVARQRETMGYDEESFSQVGGLFGPFPQVMTTARSGLIIRRSQVQVLPAPRIYLRVCGRGGRSLGRIWDE